LSIEAREMALISFLVLTALCIGGREALNIADCGPYGRRPEYTDISVVCGTSAIELAIQICPAVYTGYNETLLILNHITDVDSCKGTLDMWAVPPMLRFSFPIREGNACGSNFMTTSSAGTGIFTDFSDIQNVNVSGIVRSFDPHHRHPSSIALNDKNGSFISTLRMELYDDVNYTTPLFIPSAGVELRTKIYVQVVASNLTSQCAVDPLTTMLENGESHIARFYFSAFRFIEQQNETVSTYYLHCITRLCEQSSCSDVKGLTEPSVITVPIRTKAEGSAVPKDGVTPSGQGQNGVSVGLGVAVALLCLVGALPW
ncbi:hypothetical protein CRUP_000634, partial [Coryphaenoides rupestris]